MFGLPAVKLFDGQASHEMHNFLIGIALHWRGNAAF
jgi:hypothetical protein